MGIADGLFVIGLLLLGGGFLVMIVQIATDDFDSGLGFIAAIFAGLFLMVPAAIVHSGDEEKAFMNDCLKDKKQYECTAMWRAGESHDVPVVMPMPVYVGR